MGEGMGESEMEELVPEYHNKVDEETKGVYHGQRLFCSTVIVRTLTWQTD